MRNETEMRSYFEELKTDRQVLMKARYNLPDDYPGIEGDVVELDSQLERNSLTINTLAWVLQALEQHRV